MEVTNAWLWRVTVRGIAYGFGVIVLGFLSGLFFMYRLNGLAGLHRAFEFRPADISFDLMLYPLAFAFGFALSPLYELCKWAGSTAKAWLAGRRNSN